MKLMKPQQLELPFLFNLTEPTEAIVFTCTKKDGTIGHLYALYDENNHLFRDRNIDVALLLSCAIGRTLKENGIAIKVNKQWLRRANEWKQVVAIS